MVVKAFVCEYIDTGRAGLECSGLLLKRASSEGSEMNSQLQIFIVNFAGDYFSLEKQL